MKVGRSDMRTKEIELPYKEYIILDKQDNLDSNSFNFFDLRRVRYKFPNGLGASVIMGDLFYSESDTPFEVCPMKGDELWYDAVDSENTDVYGYITEEELYILLTKLLVKEKCE